MLDQHVRRTGDAAADTNTRRQTEAIGVAERPAQDPHGIGQPTRPSRLAGAQ
jgi:hypothetical protein